MGLKGGISIDAYSGPLHFDGEVVKVKTFLLLFRLALAILWTWQVCFQHGFTKFEIFFERKTTNTIWIFRWNRIKMAEKMYVHFWWLLKLKVDFEWWKIKIANYIGVAVWEMQYARAAIQFNFQTCITKGPFQNLWLIRCLTN